MPKQQYSTRLEKETIDRVKLLAKDLEASQSMIIEAAIDSAYLNAVSSNPISIKTAVNQSKILLKNLKALERKESK